MSFAFGFQIDDSLSATGDDTVNTPESAARTGDAKNDVGARPQNAEEDDAILRQTPARKPFVWISPDDLTDLWRRRRQRDIYCKTAIERFASNSTCLDGDEESRAESSHPDASKTSIHLRNVVLREWDDNDDDDDNRDNSAQRSASNDDASSCSEHDDSYLYGTEGSVIRNGVYEGGAAVWECSLDLVNYLLEVPSAVSANVTTNVPGSNPADDSLSQGRYVLELGCGHALPSCALLQEELLAIARSSKFPEAGNGGGEDERTRSRIGLESTFVMVDYNRSVVESITLPNLILNTMVALPTEDPIPEDQSTVEDSVNTNSIEEMLSRRIVLGSGDWLDMSEQLLHETSLGSPSSSSDANEQSIALPPDGYFDLILAAETLYTPQAALETAQLIMRHLHPHRSSTALIASKRYYFGVGGGVDDFRAAIDLSRFHVETARVIDTGAGNIREILKVTHNSIDSKN